MKVAVIGLGSMGMGAALNLVRTGHEVTGVELREAARQELVAAGGHAVGGSDALPGDLEAVIVFVVNAAQMHDVLFGPQGCASRLAEGSVVLCCTTIAPEAARTLSARLGEAGLLLLDAPVSGGAGAAKAGTMTVMASGPPEAFDKAQPVLDAIAKKVWRLGDAAGVGSTVKMVNQLLAGVHIATAAEAIALGIRAGADPQTLYDVITTSAGNSWMFQNRVPHILAGDDTPLSAVNIFVKDLGIVLDAGREAKAALPLAALAHQLFLATSGAGHGTADDSQVIRTYYAMNGGPPDP